MKQKFYSPDNYREMEIGMQLLDNKLSCRWEVVGKDAEGYPILKVIAKEGYGASLSAKPSTCNLLFGQTSISSGTIIEYYSNCCGELHYKGQYDIEEEQLPEELKRAYNELWTDGSGSLCYLAEMNGRYGIALINEFDSTTSAYLNKSMDELFMAMLSEAITRYDANPLFEDAEIICGYKSGFDDCHELIVFLPWDSDKDKVESIIEQLSGCYDI